MYFTLRLDVAFCSVCIITVYLHGLRRAHVVCCFSPVNEFLTTDMSLCVSILVGKAELALLRMGYSRWAWLWFKASWISASPWGTKCQWSSSSINSICRSLLVSACFVHLALTDTFHFCYLFHFSLLLSHGKFIISYNTSTYL